MSRKDELISFVKDVDSSKKMIAINLIDEIIFLEEQLSELRKLPMVKVHPRNCNLVKPTPVSKMYKEFLQQYNNTVKNLCSMIDDGDKKEDSPLRAFMKEFGK